ncbi:hypothetical protein [Alkalicoccus saliphilus]|jgi:hypothetical protein|uniref:Uncharacterized protein n=1 Tax=Alkalicoccus saliphilus TaxID=200989 RepID=A0A2T4U552_9BACI|nr:hypothetical protein [Alkalicoccus saliphilus]PTL38532.1 hypothetical protein C6Y45_10840 [Alkalicoccus saliphilus]
MSIHMNVFLKNENAAESLKSSLLKYHVTDVYLEEMGEEAEPGTEIIPTGYIGGTSGNPPMFSSFKKLRREKGSGHRDYPNYLLSFHTTEEYKQKVLEEIKKADGYIDKKAVE